jgi:protein SCO1/2
MTFGRLIGRTTLFAAILVAAAPSLRADQAGPKPRVESKPKELENVGVDEHLDAPLPLDATFRDEQDRPVRLGDFFKTGRPVILSLNYSDCPMLCNLQLTGLAKRLKELEWTAGTEFEVVSVSINPAEPAHRALATRQRYLQLYGRSLNGWNFLVGHQSSIDRVAEAVGFRYQYIPARKEYAHAAVAVLCTPGGKISRYLYGVDFPVQTLRLSLVEASEGKIGSPGDQLLLFCFHYDPLTGTYAPRAARLAMTVGGCVTVLAMAVWLFVLWSRDAARLPVSGPTNLNPSQPPAAG